MTCLQIILSQPDIEAVATALSPVLRLEQQTSSDDAAAEAYLTQAEQLAHLLEVLDLPPESDQSSQPVDVGAILDEAEPAITHWAEQRQAVRIWTRLQPLVGEQPLAPERLTLLAGTIPDEYVSRLHLYFARTPYVVFLLEADEAERTPLLVATMPATAAIMRQTLRSLFWEAWELPTQPPQATPDAITQEGRQLREQWREPLQQAYQQAQQRAALLTRMSQTRIQAEFQTFEQEVSDDETVQTIIRTVRETAQAPHAIFIEGEAC